MVSNTVTLEILPAIIAPADDVSEEMFLLVISADVVTVDNSIPSWKVVACGGAVIMCHTKCFA